MRLQNQARMTRHLTQFLAFITCTGWLVACNQNPTTTPRSKPNPAKPAQPTPTKPAQPTPTKPTEPTKPTPPKSKPDRPVHTRSTPTKQAPDDLPAPAKLLNAGWCVIAGSVSYRRFKTALGIRDKVRAARVTAGVYDTRNFTNLAWGQLAVIAGGITDKATAKATVKTLKAAKRRSYARKCAPQVSGAKPLDRADQLVPRAKLVTTPWVVPTKLTPGCFAWSPKREDVACLVGVSTTIEDESMWIESPLKERDWAVMLLDRKTYKVPVPAEGKPLAKDTLAKIRAAANEDGYVPLTGLESLALTPGRTLRLGKPRLAIKWKRETMGVVHNGTGHGQYRFPVWKHTLTFRCGADWEPLFDPFVSAAARDQDDKLKGTVVLIPGDRYVVVTRHDSWWRPNNGSNSHEVRLLDLETECD